MIDAIGSVRGSNVEAQSTISQEDFIRLFLAQLTFQDPNKPVDNQQFLAQMAQFASLEQTRISNETLENIAFLNSTSQATSLLGKVVNIRSPQGTDDTSTSGTVTGISFTDQGATLNINTTSGEALVGIPISQIKDVTNVPSSSEGNADDTSDNDDD